MCWGESFQGLWFQVQGLIRCLALVLGFRVSVWVSNLVVLRDVTVFFEASPDFFGYFAGVCGLLSLHVLLRFVGSFFLLSLSLSLSVSPLCLSLLSCLSLSHLSSCGTHHVMVYSSLIIGIP